MVHTLSEPVGNLKVCLKTEVTEIKVVTHMITPGLVGIIGIDASSYVMDHWEQRGIQPENIL
jgi:hypothetical protein